MAAEGRKKESRFDVIVTVLVMILSAVALPLLLGNLMQWSGEWYDLSAFNFALSLQPLLFLFVLPLILNRGRVVSAVNYAACVLASFKNKLKWHWFYSPITVASLCPEVSAHSSQLSLGKNTPFLI